MFTKALIAVVLAAMLVAGVALMGSGSAWVSALGGGLVGFFGGFVAYGSLSG